MTHTFNLNHHQIITVIASECIDSILCAEKHQNTYWTHLLRDNKESDLPFILQLTSLG